MSTIERLLGLLAPVIDYVAASVQPHDEELYQALCRMHREISDRIMLEKVHAQREPTR